MNVRNYYPLLPEIKMKKTSIEMPVVVSYAKTLLSKYPKEVVRVAYAIFRNESANGKSGVNNNYGGVQADCGVWEGLDMTNVIGTCVYKDNAGDLRRFLCFNDDGYESCFDFLCYKIQQRKMFLQTETFLNIANESASEKQKRIYNLGIKVAILYLKKWVALAKLDTPASRNNFASLYKSSLTAIA